MPEKTPVLPVLAMTILIGEKVDLPILKKIDERSLEIYLLHALCFRVLRSNVIYISNDALYLAAYLVLLWVSSTLLHDFCKLCMKACVRQKQS